MSNINWKESVEKMLDVVFNYYNATTDGDFETIEDFIVNYLCIQCGKNLNKTKHNYNKLADIFTPVEKSKKSSRMGTPKTDKSMSVKFKDTMVYVCTGNDKFDIQTKTLANIVPGCSDKSKEQFKLVSSGEVLTMTEYLKKFGFNPYDTHRVRFVVNPNVSAWLIKHNFDKFNTIEDIVSYSRGGHNAKSKA